MLILGDLKSGVQLLHFVYLPNVVLHFIHSASFKQMVEINITPSVIIDYSKIVLSNETKVV